MLKVPIKAEMLCSGMVSEKARRGCTGGKTSYRQNEGCNFADKKMEGKMNQMFKTKDNNYIYIDSGFVY